MIDNPDLRGALEYLPRRRQVKVLHVFASPGDWWSLDLNIHAANQEELVGKVLSALAAMGPDDILPAAPELAWLEFAGAPFLRVFHIPHKPRTILAAVRGSE